MTTDGSPMDGYLDQLGQEGAFNSRGHFTLTLEKLSTKLAQFQFERPGQWILRVIQGLVGSGAQSISIEQSYKKVAIYYALPDRSWTDQELEQAFLDPAFESKSEVRQIVAALWFVTINLKCRWKSVPEVGDQSPPSAIAPSKKPPKLSLLEIEYPESNSAALLKLMADRLGVSESSRAAELALELNQYAYACPVPLSLDGRRIDNLCSWSKTCKPRPSQEDQPPNAQHIYLASVGWGPVAGAPVFRIPPYTRPAKDESFGNIRIEALPEAEMQWAALLTVDLETQVFNREQPIWTAARRPSSIHWIKDGVLVGQTLLETKQSVSCQLFVSADQLDTDLSGLKLNDASSPKPAQAIGRGVGDWLQQQRLTLRAPKGSSPGRDKLRELVAISVMAPCVLAFLLNIPPHVHLLPNYLVSLCILGLFAWGFDRISRKLMPIQPGSKGLRDSLDNDLAQLRMDWEDLIAWHKI